MFDKTADFYDAIYSFKDYADEAQRLHDLIDVHKESDGRALLDVACGTGQHAVYLSGHYDVEGLDLDENMLAIARAKNPGVAFYQGDMTDFHLGRRYDVVICLFSSIAYTRSLEGLHAAVRAMANHTLPGGVVIIEGWLRPDELRDRYVSTLTAEKPGIKIARMSFNTIEGDLFVLQFDYLVGTENGITHFTERHELGTFAPDDYLAAMELAGLELAAHDPVGWTGRAIYVGRQRSAFGGH